MSKDAEKADSGAGKLLETLTELTGLDFKGLTLAGAGAAAAVGIKEGVETAEEQTDARGHMAAYTGKTGEELAALEEVGKDVYRQGYGESLMDAAQGVATLHSYTGAVNQELQGATEIAFRMRDVFGHDIPESARTAQQLMTVFGISARDAYGLMAAGAQEGADKSGNLLDTLNEYAPYYEMAGKSAEEFIGTLINGAQNGIYDVDKIGDAMKEFTDLLTDGSETTKEALKSLGVETMDLPSKFKEGGETASAAFDLVIDKLLGVEDSLMRDQLGAALFGQTWHDTGGAILKIFDEIGMSSVDIEKHLGALNETRLDDLGEGLERVSRHVETVKGEMMEAPTKAAAHLVHGVADVLDEVEAKREIAQQKAEETVEAVKQETAGLYDELDALNAKIAEADASGNYAESYKLQAQREQLMKEIARTATEVVEGHKAMGEDAASALGGTAPQMESAGEDVGEAVVLGFENGTDSLEDAGSDASDGAVSGMESGIDDAYDAGYATGQAYERGYRDALDTHSPSRVMEDAAGDTTAGLLERLRRDRERLYEAGAALGEAVSGGYGSGAGGGMGASYGGASGFGGVSKGELAAAMREALEGLAWETDIGTFARLVEPGVSQATQQRAQATVRGQSSLVKRW